MNFMNKNIFTQFAMLAGLINHEWCATDWHSYGHLNLYQKWDRLSNNNIIKIIFAVTLYPVLDLCLKDH